MKITQGFLVLGSSSALFASAKPSTFLAYSTTASCIPRQIPRYGTLFSLACLAARIFPCTPLFPKPPGTRIPSAPLSNFHAALYASGFCREESFWFSVLCSEQELSVKCEHYLFLGPLFKITSWNPIYDKFLAPSHRSVQESLLTYTYEIL